MSYEVLARRWRPRSFDEVVGQDHVTRTLRNALETDRLPHALLLCGPRGTGKTSIARLLARGLNCDNGPTDKPCGECSSCKEIGGSTSLDVQEIDAASHTGVDNVREIRDSVRFSAAPGKHRIFIIDEVHMLSQAAFNALLKTLEEPPPRSLFIFATTDPQKIPATVLSRVQRFDLKRLASSDALERLREIATHEKLEVDESVLRALVREADGSLRDAQTLLDRLISGLGARISEEDAIAVLDLVDRKIVNDVMDPVLARDPGSALEAVRRGLDKGVEPARLAAALLEDLRNLIVARVAQAPETLIDVAAEELAEIKQRADAQDAEALQRLFRVLLSRNQELVTAPRAEHALEMAVVRMASLPEAEALASLVARLSSLEAGPPRGGPASGGGGSGARPASGGRRPASSGGSRDRGARAAPRAEAAKAEPARAEPPAAEPPRAEPKPEPRSAAPEPAAPAPAKPAPPEKRPAAVPTPSASASQDEPPPPDDRDAPAASRAAPHSMDTDPAEAERGTGNGAPVMTAASREAEREEQMRKIQEARQHKAVREVIEILDAEIRDIRTQARP
jgi:DNA polymerase-3 subunit gamma/tau